MIWLVLGIVLAVTAVVLVALPFLREPVAADDRLDAKTEADERRLALVEERDRALAALKELEFDHPPARSATRTIARSSGRSGAPPPRR
jgi:hypothetical protein